MENNRKKRESLVGHIPAIKKFILGVHEFFSTRKVILSYFFPFDIFRKGKSGLRDDFIVFLDEFKGFLNWFIDLFTL